jgi:SOS-response transcriptional repressor LexA
LSGIMAGVTPQQYKLLTYIRNQIIHFGNAPTFSEMKKFMEVTSNQTIGDWIEILEREGYIKKDKGRLRGIGVTSKGKKGFGENLQVQNPETIKKEFAVFSSYTSSSTMVFNYTPNNTDNGINIKTNNVIPVWEGGEKSGTS